MATITTTTPPENLTGYTVNVPAGFTVSSGFGSFVLEGSYSFEEGLIEQGDFSEIFLGYNNGGLPSSNSVMFAPDFVAVSSANGFTVRISGGSQSGDSTVIQWLVDNNATFTKEGEEEPDTPETTTPHGEIYYKGELVATLVEGETITLHTKDFKFLGDIVIKNVGEAEEETPTLISFTIGSTTYQAEEGMTWADWCASEYNTDGWYEHPMTGTPSDGYVAVTLVTMEDEIIVDTEYNTGSLPEGIG